MYSFHDVNLDGGHFGSRLMPVSCANLRWLKTQSSILLDRAATVVRGLRSSRSLCKTRLYISCQSYALSGSHLAQTSQAVTQVSIIGHISRHCIISKLSFRSTVLLTHVRRENREKEKHLALRETAPPCCRARTLHYAKPTEQLLLIPSLEIYLENDNGTESYRQETAFSVSGDWAQG